MTLPSDHATITEDSATSRPVLSPDRHRQTRTACAFRSTPHETAIAAQTPDLTGTNDHQAGSPAAHLPRNTAADSESYPDWEAVYRDNVDRVYRLMFAKVGNRPDAEDLTAEVFLAALPPLRVSASAAQVRAYLLATARTVLARYWRRTLGQEITTFTDQNTLEAVLADPPASADTADRTAMILAQLPPSYRRILQLRFLESRSVREAAAALGVSVAAGKVLQHRALRRAAQLKQATR